jgi:5'-nucleotidase
MKTIQNTTILVFLLVFNSILYGGERIKLTILHTNDTHSQIEPTEKSNLTTSDRGGYAQNGSHSTIRLQNEMCYCSMRRFLAGTPYFNFYNGRIEVNGMNRMKYDAVTLGNHEFDNGIDTMAAILKNARFPVLTSNYQMDSTAMATLVKPYLIIRKAGLKIGVMALNVNPKGLIFKNNYKGMNYVDPVETAINISNFLKRGEKCDLIICLSHLGADTLKQTLTDYDIIRKTRYIDVVIGGHSHQIITQSKVKNAAGKPVVLAQMGKSGLYLGRIDLELEKR